MNTLSLISSIFEREKPDDDQPIEAIDRDPYAKSVGLSELAGLFVYQLSTKSRILVNLLGMLATIRWGGKGLLIGTTTSAVCQVVEERWRVRRERDKEIAEEKEGGEWEMYELMEEE
ncbi:MAG: hypothetical protein Q9174_007356 [Haloplaca sp. 1 TL-2023]